MPAGRGQFTDVAAESSFIKSVTTSVFFFDFFIFNHSFRQRLRGLGPRQVLLSVLVFSFFCNPRAQQAHMFFELNLSIHLYLRILGRGPEA